MIFFFCISVVAVVTSLSFVTLFIWVLSFLDEFSQKCEKVALRGSDHLRVDCVCPVILMAAQWVPKHPGH